MQKEHESLRQAKSLFADNRQECALRILEQAFTPKTDLQLLMRAAKWTAKVRWTVLTPLRAVFLGCGTLEPVIDLVRFWLVLFGYGLHSYLPPYNSWKMAVLNPTDKFYIFRPEIVWLFSQHRDACLRANPALGAEGAETAVKYAIADMENTWSILGERLPTAVIMQNTIEPPPWRVCGNLEAELPGSGQALYRDFNSRMIRSALAAGVHIFDMARLATEIGLRDWYDHGLWHYSKIPFSPAVSGEVAFRMARTIAASKGKSKKVLVLDLDNTLWGGVAADDGLEGLCLGIGSTRGEAYSAFQGYLKGLSDRGIVLAVASKNSLENAILPFREHPGMQLSLNDIAVFKANWRNKADNIREISKTLSLSLDSFVFFDDNPAERDLVRSELPMVAVPDVPEDPSLFIDVLDRMAYFESIFLSGEDMQRSEMYKATALRLEARSQVTNVDEYLKSLEMHADSGCGDEKHSARMAQLVNKSNQFHLTTTRYSEKEFLKFINDKECITQWFSLQDKYGDQGMVAVLLLKKDTRFPEGLLIDTWAMSCRVLERGMEEYILQTLAQIAYDSGANRLIGWYIPTKKNGLVADLYDRLGFSQLPADTDENRYWFLDLPAERRGRALFISPKERKEPGDGE